MNCNNLVTKNSITMTTGIVDISISPNTTAIRNCPDGVVRDFRVAEKTIIKNARAQASVSIWARIIKFV